MDEITLTVRRVPNSESRYGIDYIATFPSGMTQQFSVKNDANSQEENCLALRRAADLWQSILNEEKMKAEGLIWF